MNSLKDEQKELERQKHVAFLSGQRRLVFPGDTPVDRMGAGLSTGGDPDMGPARYNVDEKTSTDYLSKTKLTSKLGYSLAARTGPRIPGEAIENIPGPGAYESKNTLKMASTSHKLVPFLSPTDRFVKQKMTSDETVGPSQYEHNLNRNRHVNWEGTFGGAPKNIPKVDHESFIPSNTDKLLSAVENRRYNRRLAYLKLYYENNDNGSASAKAK